MNNTKDHLYNNKYAFDIRDSYNDITFRIFRLDIGEVIIKKTFGALMKGLIEETFTNKSDFYYMQVITAKILQYINRNILPDKNTHISYKVFPPIESVDNCFVTQTEFTNDKYGMKYLIHIKSCI